MTRPGDPRPPTDLAGFVGPTDPVGPGDPADAPRAGPLFHVVLVEPEIPNNTGNIGRTCIATGCALHLVRPLGFDTSEKALRRAGLDYWPRLAVREHEHWEAFERWWSERAARVTVADPPTARGLPPPQRPPALWLTSGLRGTPAWDADLRPGDALVFGKETAGLPGAMLEAHADRLLTLPMAPGERGLNLATAVCAIVYEGIRQGVERAELSLDADGRLRRRSLRE